MTTRRRIVHLFALCLNEARMIPYFLRHYDGLVDAFHISDNGSTDQSLALLRGDPRVRVEPFKTEGDSFVDVAKRLQNSVWKASRGVADWVVVVEMDEHLFHPDLAGYLDHCFHTGVTVIRSQGYNMFADRFPVGQGLLSDEATRGVPFAMFDKLAIFRPEQVEEVNYEAGRHGDRPVGHVVFEPQPQVKLLHYKHLGVDYVCERNAALVTGLKDGDRRNDWGVHYRAERRQVEDTFAHHLPLCRRVPGLGRPTDAFDLTLDDEQWLIGGSGLFDRSYYGAQFDRPVDGDPLLHYAMVGWREKRRPNPFFDPAWYERHYASFIPAGVNPLVEYILAGERQGRMPCVHFDAARYRLAHNLPPHIGALAHLLARRRSAQT